MLSFSSSALDLKLKGRLAFDNSDGEYSENVVEARLKHDVVGDGYRLVTWLRSRNNEVNHGMRLTLGNDTISTQIGTHSAFYGFLAQDDVSYSGLVMLPQGVYTQKFVNGGFSYYNGISLNYSLHSGSHSWQFTIGQGKPYILDYDTWEESLVSRVDPWIDIDGVSYTNFRMGYEYSRNLQILAVHDTIALSVRKQWDWSMLDLYKAFPNIGSSFLVLDPAYKLTIQRLGAEIVLNNRASIIAEYARLTVDNGTYNLPGSNNFYAVGYYSFGARYELVLGRSMGNPENRNANTDTFIGLHYCRNGLNVVIEYHKVVGDSWWHKKGSDSSLNAILVGWSYGL
jgi:hypothetical protein